MENQRSPVCLIVGVGPGVGTETARRFGAAGYDLAMIARNEDRLQTLEQQLQSEGVTAGWTAVDVTDDAAFTAAVERFGQHTGHIDVLHFNPSATTMADPLTLTPQQLLADVHLGVASLLTAVQAARPFLSSGARVVATGSMSADSPWAAAATVGVQKAALRNLVGAVDASLAPAGIRAATLTVHGVIEAGGRLSPERIADALYDLSQTPDADWRTEAHLRST